MEETKEKVCPKCGRLLPLDEFYNSSSTKDGHTSWCKDCMRDSIKFRRESRKEMKMKRASALLQITPREMMIRLARMGYKGVLIYETQEKETITHDGHVGEFTYTKRNEIDIVKLMNEGKDGE